MSQRIIIFHTLNDFSGSPNVLASVIRGLAGKGYKIDLYTSSSETGHLSGIPGVNYHTVFYRFTNNKFVTLIRFILLQLRYFFISLQYHGNNDVIFYINTILPFGAALGGKLIHKKLIYHVHENPVIKNLIHKIAIEILLKYSDKTLFVSKWLFDSYVMNPERKILVTNALSPEFTKVAKEHQPEFSTPFSILMISSLKKYKGIDMFLDLALKLEQFNFCLVLNAGITEIKNYFKDRKVPKNFRFFPGTDNLHQFYSKAHLLVNLSLPELCIESFGLTILEALAYGIPVIVPPIGGVAELVEDGINGFKANPHNQPDLIDKISGILSDEAKYSLLSLNSRRIAGRYSYKAMIDKIEEVIAQL